MDSWQTSFEQMRGISSFMSNYDPNASVSTTKKKMIAECESMVPFSVSQTILGKHLTLMRTGAYWPSTSAPYAKKVNCNVSLNIKEERMVVFELLLDGSAEKAEKVWAAAKGESIAHGQSTGKVWGIKKTGKSQKTDKAGKVNYSDSH